RAELDERHLGDGARSRGRNGEVLPVGNLRRSVADLRAIRRRAVLVEEVWGPEDLRVEVVWLAGRVRLAPPAGEDAAVGKEQGGGVVEALHGHGRERGPTLGGGIPQLGLEDRSRGVVVSGRARAAR